MTKFINISATLLIAISISMFTACKKKEAHCSGYSMATEDAIQGTWLHQYPEKNQFESDLSLPIKYQIKFKADSFFLIKNYFTDFVTPECNYFDFLKYYSGTYKITNEVLSLKGLQTSSEFDTDPATIDTCHYYPPGGQEHTEDFGIYFCNGDLMLEVYEIKDRLSNTDFWYYVRMNRE